MAMLNLDTFSELLEVLYSAPLNQDHWQTFLALLCRHTQTEMGVFLCADSRMGLSIRASGGAEEGSQTLPQEDISAYNEIYSRHDPFREALLRSPRTGVMQDEDLLPNEGLLHTQMYREFIEPRGGRYATLLILSLGLRRLEAITLWRAMHLGPLEEERVHLLNLVFPHIQKALEIRRLLGVTQQQLAGAEAMLGATDTATFLLTRQGSMLQCNAAADTILQAGSSPLTLQDGNLVAKDAASSRRLRHLLTSSTLPNGSTPATRPVHALALPRTGNRRPLHLLASPLPSEHCIATGADVLLLVTDPDRPSHFPDSVLEALYGLTPAEIEVANGLLTGYVAEEIASLRRVALGTVRQQLKSILVKTGVSRQADLVRLLMTLPQPSAMH